MFHVKHLCIIKNLQLAPYIILAKKNYVKKLSLAYKHIPTN